MSAFDFSGLTPAQCIAMGGGTGWTLASLPNPQPGPRTVAKLIARGILLKRSTPERAGPFTMLIPEYPAAPGVREAWLAHRREMRKAAKRRGRASAFQLWRTADHEWGFGEPDDITWMGWGPAGKNACLDEAEACS